MNEPVPANGARSPAGDPHPGDVVHDDRVDGRSYTRPAEDMPWSMIWVQSDEGWLPVTRIEVTGTPERRRITKFGEQGARLETTVFHASGS